MKDIDRESGTASACPVATVNGQSFKIYMSEYELRLFLKEVLNGYMLPAQSVTVSAQHSVPIASQCILHESDA